MTSTAIFDKVASGEMTADEGADKLIAQRTKEPIASPAWMPRWLYVVGVLVVSVVLAPILSSRRSNRCR